MSSAFYIPALNLMGEGALEEAARQIQLQGFKHALIVTDGVLNKIGVAASVQQLLKKYQIDSAIYDGVQPNPTVANVDAGLKILKANHSDCVVSLGGGLPTTAPKGSRCWRPTAARSPTMKAWMFPPSRSCR
ncbi:Alcohol dehydrogenase 2 [Dickeya solani]|nr:Alcohol dehydrogenase 2 [Dickeya solani]